ncbi:MAG: preprotein translocase subunit SecE [Chloroflexota bacterium]
MAVKTEKTKQVEKTKQPGRIARFWRETVGELRKVAWPTLPDARRLTMIVLVVMAIMAVFLGLMDFVFSAIIGLILG